MTLIWLYLLGLTHILSGHFSSLEIAMTIVVGLASIAGIALVAHLKSGLSAATGIILFVIFAVFQFACFRASFLPSIARH